MPLVHPRSGQSHGFSETNRTYRATQRGGDRASTQHQIDDVHHTHGNSQAIVKHNGDPSSSQAAGKTSRGRSSSQTIAKSSGGHSSSKALDSGNYGRNQEYVRQSPDPSPNRGGVSRAHRSGATTRYNTTAFKASMKSVQPSRSSATYLGNTEMTKGGRMNNSSRLGGIEEEDEYGYGGMTMQPTRGRSHAMTTYGGASTGVSRRNHGQLDDDSDSDQEVIAKKRFSQLSGELLFKKFPDLGQLLEDVLQIKPAKLEEYCESHFIRLDLSKNRADISKLLKNCTPNDREKVQKAIKRHTTHMDNEHQLHGGKPPRSILEPLEDNHRTARGVGTIRGAGSSRGVASSRNAESSRELVTTRSTELSRDVVSTHDGNSTRDGSPSRTASKTTKATINPPAVRETVFVDRPVVVGHVCRPRRRYVHPSEFYDDYDDPYYHHHGWY